MEPCATYPKHPPLVAVDGGNWLTAERHLLAIQV